VSRADDHALPGTIVSPFHHKDVSSGKARISPYRKDTTHWRWAHRRPRPCEIGVAAYPSCEIGVAAYPSCEIGVAAYPSKTKMVLEPRFKGVWPTAADFAPLPLPDTRQAQSLRPPK